MKSDLGNRNIEFPARVLVIAPDQVRLEVMDLFGGTVAQFIVNGDRYEIHQVWKSKQIQGEGDWKGIPIRWISTLLLGLPLCPDLSQVQSVEWEGDRGLKAVVTANNSSQQFFRYETKSFLEHPWITKLEWALEGNHPKKVTFEFESPGEEDGVPRRWSARSVEAELKVRWRERSVVR